MSIFEKYKDIDDLISQYKQKDRKYEENILNIRSEIDKLDQDINNINHKIKDIDSKLSKYKKNIKANVLEKEEQIDSPYQYHGHWSYNWERYDYNPINGIPERKKREYNIIEPVIEEVNDTHVTYDDHEITDDSYFY